MALKTQIYIVRHGQSQGNVEGRFQGRIDLPLTALGIKQTYCVAEYFRNININCIYSSPLQRAAATAEAVNQYHNRPIGYIEGLMEISLGSFEGRSQKDISLTEKERLQVWHDNPEDFCAPNGESMSTVYNRIVSTVGFLEQRHQGQTLVLCSHGCTIRNLLCWANGFSVKEIALIPWSGNCAVSLVEITDSGMKNIVFQNQNSHLPIDLQTGIKGLKYRKR